MSSEDKCHEKLCCVDDVDVALDRRGAGPGSGRAGGGSSGDIRAHLESLHSCSSKQRNAAEQSDLHPKSGFVDLVVGINIRLSTWRPNASGTGDCWRITRLPPTGRRTTGRG